MGRLRLRLVPLQRLAVPGRRGAIGAQPVGRISGHRERGGPHRGGSRRPLQHGFRGSLCVVERVGREPGTGALQQRFPPRIGKNFLLVRERS